MPVSDICRGELQPHHTSNLKLPVSTVRSAAVDCLRELPLRLLLGPSRVPASVENQLQLTDFDLVRCAVASSLPSAARPLFLKMDNATSPSTLLHSSNPVLRGFAFYASILIIKMMLMSTLTGAQRFRKKVNPAV